MNFHKVTLEDLDWIRRVMAETNHKSCEESFANLYTWGNEFGMEVAEVEGTLVCKLGHRYSIPIGKNREVAICKVIDLYETDHIEMFGIETEDFAFLEQHFNHIRAFYDRRWSDYIYSREKLGDLTGKKLAAKRNHINAFMREYPDWHVEPITPENLPAVMRFHQYWASVRDQGYTLKEELLAAEIELARFFEMKLDGLVLYADGEIVGYSYGEPITDQTYCVHVEKALASVRGAYPMINREFVRAYCDGYEYINREDDSGEKGLRKAKMSYGPLMILHKYEAEMEKK